jgi:hypothetical protein
MYKLCCKVPACILEDDIVCLDPRQAYVKVLWSSRPGEAAVYFTLHLSTGIDAPWACELCSTRHVLSAAV